MAKNKDIWRWAKLKFLAYLIVKISQDIERKDILTYFFADCAMSELQKIYKTKDLVKLQSTFAELMYDILKGIYKMNPDLLKDKISQWNKHLGGK